MQSFISCQNYDDRWWRLGPLISDKKIGKEVKQVKPWQRTSVNILGALQIFLHWFFKMNKTARNGAVGKLCDREKIWALKKVKDNPPSLHGLF